MDYSLFLCVQFGNHTIFGDLKSKKTLYFLDQKTIFMPSVDVRFYILKI